MIKTGQGGSQVLQWNVGGTYWTKFLQRIVAAKSQLPPDKKWVVFLSLGINDAIAGNNVAVWKTNMVEWINIIKADLSGALIDMTQFQSMGYANYNTALGEVAESQPNVYVVSSLGAGLRDSNHWSYAGLKTVTNSMVSVAKNVLGLNFPGKPSGLNLVPSATSMQLSWTAPVASGTTAIGDYKIEYKLASATSWTTFVDGVSTSANTQVTGLSGGTNYDFRVSAANSYGFGNFVAGSQATTDANTPVISAINAVADDNSVEFTWETNEAASSKIEYGFVSGYGFATSDTNTSPRVTSH